MSETDIEKHFGLIDAEKATGLSGHIAGGKVKVVAFAAPLDTRWCTQAREAQARENRTKPNITKPVPDMRELSQRVTDARAAGEVPFSIEGPAEEIPGFLNRAGIAEIELIPPLT